MREGAWASQRMLVFELISAHANITPTRTMPSAQFISSRLLPSRKGITRCRHCCGHSRGRQSTPWLSHHLPSCSRPRRHMLQSRLSNRPLAMVSCNNLFVHIFHYVFNVFRYSPFETPQKQIFARLMPSIGSCSQFCLILQPHCVPVPFPPTFASSWRAFSSNFCISFVQIHGGTTLLKAKFGTTPQERPKNDLNWGVGPSRHAASRGALAPSRHAELTIRQSLYGICPKIHFILIFLSSTRTGQDRLVQINPPKPIVSL